MNRNLISALFILFAGLVMGARTAGSQDFYTVSGIVTSDLDEEPVQFVYVQAYWNGDAVSGAYDSTDSEGQYSFEINSGTYDVDFQPPPESGLRPKLVEGVDVFDDVELDVVLQSANKIEGFVRDGQGEGIPNIDLNVYDQASGEQLDISGDDTDSEGYYDIFVPDGIYRIVYRPVFGERYVPVELTDVEVFADIWIDVVLEDGYFVSGYVTDPDGYAVVDADIDAEDSETGEKIYTAGDNTNAEGFYQIILPVGVYNISVEPPEGENLAPAIAYDVSVFGDITLDFFLETGYRVYGTVRGPMGSGVADADLNVENSDTGEELYTPGDDTDESGDYQVIVPAGNYDIHVVPQIDDRLVPAIEYDVFVFSDYLLDFNLEAGHLVTGTVTDPEESRVDDVDLDIVDPSTEEKLFTPHDNTDDSGIYEIVIPPGVYDIDFKPPVVDPYLAPLRLQDQYVLTDVVIDVTLAYGVLLTGLVQNNDQAGVESVDIDAIDTSDNTDVPLVGDYTDSNGEFTTVVAPGTYNLEIKPPQARRLAAELLPDYQLNVDTYIEVTLDSGMVASGTVTDYTGNPMADVTVAAVVSSTQQEAFTPGNETDPSGVYRILVKPDTYDLTFIPDPAYGCPDSTLYDIEIFSDATINFQFSEPEPDTEPPTVTVLSPDGGEIWPVYSNQIISWTATDNIGVTSIDIYCSVTGSNGPYNLISTGETNDGSYLWNIPPTPTEDARVKIVAHDAWENTGEDISDAAFTIYADPSDCSYIPGDTDHNGTPIELSDVIVMIGIYRGNAPPYYTCECPPHGASFAPEADPNGNCVTSELSDVVIEIGAYRGSAEASGCVDCPGLRRTTPNNGTDNSPFAPPLKSKATYPRGTDSN